MQVIAGYARESGQKTAAEQKVGGNSLMTAGPAQNVYADDFTGDGQVQKACIEIRKASMEEKENDVLSGAMDRLKGNAPLFPLEEDRRRFYVPFNPSEISLEGLDGATREKKNFQKGTGGAKGMVYQAKTSMIDLRVKLIFDRTWYEDDNVQPQAEGFLAAVKNPATRALVFQWNDFRFAGTLTSVSVQYKMFSPSGFPVRAEAQLCIRGQKEQAKELEKDFQRLLDLS